MISTGISLRQVIQAKASFQGSGNRRMVIDAVIDQVARDERRYDDGRNARPVLLERELILIYIIAEPGIARCDCRRRSHMVEESPVLIPRDDEQTTIPYWRVTNGLIGAFNQRFSASDVVEWMLRCAAFVIREDVTVARLNEGV